MIHMYVYITKHSNIMDKYNIRLDAGAHAYNPNTLGGQGRQVTDGQ